MFCFVLFCFILFRFVLSCLVLGCTKHAIAFKDFACDVLVNTIKVPLTTVKFWKNSINEEATTASVSTSASASEPISGGEKAANTFIDVAHKLV